MSLNELPDVCLLSIIKNFKVIEDFISFAKVCLRFEFLARMHLSKIKCLMSQSTIPCARIVRDPASLRDPDLSKFLSELKIFDLTLALEKNTLEDIKRIIRNNPSISTIVYPLSGTDGLNGYCFERVNSKCKDREPKFFQPNNVIQIYFRKCFLPQLTEYTSKYPNLTRIHINDMFFYDYFDNSFYSGPMLMNCEILEFTISSSDGLCLYPGFHLMDQCPSLKSAYFFAETKNYEVDESIKNLNLQDLVIQFLGDDYSQQWTSLRTLLSKFPNLKHLAIRNNSCIKNEHVQDLLQLLPQIELLDFRRSENITQRSARYVERYCRETGKSITIYYNFGPPEPANWPKLNAYRFKICFGFDFMKHCFYRAYYNLPLLMQPQQS